MGDRLPVGALRTLALRTLALLVSIQGRSFAHGLGAGSGRGRARAAGIAALYLLLAVTVLVYLHLLGAGMVAAGAVSAIPVMATLIGALASVVLVFVKAPGIVFGCRDYDLMASLPVPASLVVLARTLPLYAVGAAVSLVCSAPLYASYFSELPPSLAAVAAAVLCAVLAPCAPIALAVLASLALTAVAVRFRHAGAVQLVLSVLFAAVVLIASFALGGASGGMDDAAAARALGGISDMIASAAGSAYPPAAWAAGAIAGTCPVAIIPFTALSLALPGCVTALLARWYPAANALATAGGHARRGSARALSGRDASPLRALTVKELRTVASMPSYALNTCAGLILMVVAAGAIAAVGVDGILLAGAVDGVQIEAADLASISGQVDAALPWVFGFCGAISLTAAPSVSLEGRSSWIMLTIPVGTKAVLASKLLANLVVGGAAIAVSSAVLLAGGLAPASVLACAVAPAGMLVGFASISLALDARRPNYTFIAPTEVVKRGLPMMVGSLGGVAATFALGFISVLIASAAGGAAAFAFTLIVPVCFAAMGLAVLLRTARRPLAG